MGTVLFLMYISTHFNISNGHCVAYLLRILMGAVLCVVVFVVLVSVLGVCAGVIVLCCIVFLGLVWLGGVLIGCRVYNILVGFCFGGLLCILFFLFVLWSLVFLVLWITVLFLCCYAVLACCFFFLGRLFAWGLVTVCGGGYRFLRGCINFFCIFVVFGDCVWFFSD